MFINPSDGDVDQSLAQSSRIWFFESRPYVLVNKTGVNINNSEYCEYTVNIAEWTKSKFHEPC